MRHPTVIMCRLSNEAPTKTGFVIRSVLEGGIVFRALKNEDDFSQNIVKVYDGMSDVSERFGNQNGCSKS